VEEGSLSCLENLFLEEGKRTALNEHLAYGQLSHHK
jgi:hypothetical protein